MDKPDYAIINDGAGFALYRKLFHGEEVWYINELHRLKIEGEDIWLNLDKNMDRRVLEKELLNIKKSKIINKAMLTLYMMSHIMIYR